MYTFTKEDCARFTAQPDKNPKTNRKIKEGSKVYRTIQKQCSVYSTASPRPKKNDSAMSFLQEARQRVLPLQMQIDEARDRQVLVGSHPDIIFSFDVKNFGSTFYWKNPAAFESIVEDDTTTRPIHMHFYPGSCVIPHKYILNFELQTIQTGSARTKQDARKAWHDIAAKPKRDGVADQKMSDMYLYACIILFDLIKTSLAYVRANKLALLPDEDEKERREYLVIIDAQMNYLDFCLQNPTDKISHHANVETRKLGQALKRMYNIKLIR